MSVEVNSEKESHELVHRSVDFFRQKMVELYQLSAKAIKKVDTLGQIISHTALAACEPTVTPQLQTMTFRELNLLENPEQMKSIEKIAITDLDGVIKIGQPYFKNLLALREIARRVDSLYISTSRFSPDEDSWFWRNIGHFFKSGTAISRFPFFTKQETENFEKRFFPGKTRVVCGFKGFSQNSHEAILKDSDHHQVYLVCAGSGALDYIPFAGMLKWLKDNNFPSENIAYCDVGPNLLL